MEARGRHKESSIVLLQTLTAILVVLVSDVSCIGSGGVASGGVASGSGLGSGISGSAMQGCVSAGFTTCCVPSFNQSCVVNDGEIDMCSCDAECFANDTCCFDIIDVPCLPDIFVEFTPQNYTISEDGGFVIVTVTANGFPGGEFDTVNVTVLLMTEDGTAEASIDFEGVITQLVFSADGSWDVMIPILTDNAIEANEFFTVGLTSSSPFVIFNNDEAFVTIVDVTTGTVSLVTPTLSVLETDGSVRVCAVIENAILERDVVAFIQTTPLTATDPDDYSGGIFDLIFARPNTTACVYIGIETDDIFEADEDFLVNLNSIDPAIMLGAITSATITILDETEIPINFTVSDPIYVEAEDNGFIEVCLAVFGNLDRDVTITLSTADITAESPADYESTTVDLVFDATTSEVCTNITLQEDLFVEIVERFRLLLNTLDPDVTFVRQMIQVGIVDSTRAVIEFEMLNYTFQENVSSAMVCVIQTTLRPVTFIREVSLMFNTAPGTATSPMDFTELMDIEIEFPTTSCISIDINDDSAPEPDEYFTLVLTSTDPAVILVDQIARITITDNDDVMAEIGIEFANYDAAEDIGNVEVCVVADGLLTQDVPLFLLSEDDTAVSATGGIEDDYDPISENLVLLAGLDTRVCVNVTIIDDEADENNENFTITLVTPGPNPWPIFRARTVVTIIDNDEVQVGFEAEQFEVTEAVNDSVIVCVVLDGPLQRDGVVVDLFFTDVTATNGLDYLAVNERLVFNSGDQIMCIEITIFDDVEVEGTETFRVGLQTVTGEMTGISQAIVTILDNDFENVTLSFEQMAYSVIEGNIGSQALNVCVISDSVVTRDGIVAFINSFEFPGEAEAGVDFEQVSETVTFNTGDAIVCIDVIILGDILVEGNERFSLILTSVDAEVGLLGTIVTILDDDIAPGPMIEFDQQQGLIFDEDAENTTVCVVLVSGTITESVVLQIGSGAMGDTATVDVDYTQVMETLTFMPGDTRMCFTLDILDDEIGENNEVLTLTINSQPRATVTIVDDDEVIITFSQGMYFVNEGDDLSVPIVANRMFVNGPFFVTVTSENDSAESPLDFDAIDEDVVFSGPTSVTVRANSDSLIEPNEQFLLRLRNTATQELLSTAIIIIININPPVFDIDEQQGLTFGEGAGIVSVCVVLVGGTITESTMVLIGSGVFGDTATVDVDYTRVMETLIFMPGDTEMCFDLEILDDDFVEGNEMLTLTIDNQPAATVTIIDDDGNLIVTFQEPIMAVDEALKMLPVCVDFVGSVLNTQAIVSLSTVFTNDADEGDDYIGETAEIMYFPSIVDVIICENITIIDDLLEEDFELFGVTLTSNNPAVSFLVSSAVVIIVDDDALDLTAGFVQTDVQVLETDGLTSARLRAFVNGKIVEPVTLTFTIIDGTATENLDYIDANAELVFNSNSDNALKDFYTILGDVMVEDDEDIVFQLSAAPSEVEVIPTREIAVVTIIDDDVIPDVAGVIELIDDTPEIITELGGLTATVRIRFTLSPVAFSATCALQELRPIAVDCTSGEFTFTGIPADRATPLFLEITAYSQLGQQLAFLTRPVRIGLNGDCVVNFLNGVEQAIVFEDEVHVQFSLLGPFNRTECRLDDTVFLPCTSPVSYNNLTPGDHSVKVRPEGDNCSRRIRRTVTFTIV